MRLLDLLLRAKTVFLERWWFIWKSLFIFTVFKYCAGKCISSARVSFCFPSTLDCKCTSSCFPQGALFRCVLSYITVTTFILCVNNYTEYLLFSKVLCFFDVFLAIMNCCVVTVYFMLTVQVTHSLCVIFPCLRCLCLWTVTYHTW